MDIKTIKGLYKKDFVDQCMKSATEINPTWMMDDFRTSRFDSKWVWIHQSTYAGFALSTTGVKFLSVSLQIKPYIIQSQGFRLLSKTIIKLDKYMPWPYRIEPVPDGAVLQIFSSEVAVWAAMYDNDINKLLEIYESSAQ